jgi:hypothetical protein
MRSLIITYCGMVALWLGIVGIAIYRANYPETEFTAHPAEIKVDMGCGCIDTSATNPAIVFVPGVDDAERY